jgi:GMP synthase (glutamine-hydrolysing)
MRLLVFQHVAAEPLGTLDPLIRARGHRVRFVNFEREPDAVPSVDRYRGLIVLGGPMNVEDHGHRRHLVTEMRAIERALHQGKPVLGICLGAQLLAHVLGARVRRADQTEIGWYDLKTTESGAGDPVLQAFAPDARVFQWHSYTFDLPTGAVQLARTASCEQQAFRYGDNAYGVQFHPEVDAPLISRWMRRPDYAEELCALAGTGGTAAIASEVPSAASALVERSERAFNAFLDLIGRPAKRVVLSSR